MDKINTPNKTNCKSESEVRITQVNRKTFNMNIQNTVFVEQVQEILMIIFPFDKIILVII